MNDKRILVVDDETDLLEMVKSIFTRAGFTQIWTASSGEAALKMCEEQEPDMMILDVMMPGMDGFAALKELRKTSKIPVLMLTARGEAEDESTLATHIRHLREKIEENPSKPVALVTIKGIGYRLNIKGVQT